MKQANTHHKNMKIFAERTDAACWKQNRILSDALATAASARCPQLARAVMDARKVAIKGSFAPLTSNEGYKALKTSLLLAENAQKGICEDGMVIYACEACGEPDSAIRPYTPCRSRPHASPSHVELRFECPLCLSKRNAETKRMLEEALEQVQA